MPNTAVDDAPDRRRVPRGLIAVCVVIVALFAAWTAWRSALTREIDQRYADIHAKGEPTLPGDLNDWRPEPTGKNLVEELHAAWRSYVEPKTLDLDPDPLPISKSFADAGCAWGLGDPIPASERDGATKFLKANDATIRALHAAAAIEAGWLNVDYRDGYSVVLPDIGDSREMINCLALDSAAALDAGDTRRAVDSILATFAVARALEGEPMLVAHLVVVSCHQLAGEQVRHAVAHSPLTEAQLATLAGALDRFDAAAGLHRAMVGERVSGLMIFNHPTDLTGIGGGGSSFGWRAHAAVGTLGIDHLTYLDLMTRMVDGAKLPPADRAKAFADADAELRRLAASRVSRMLRPITMLLTPAVARISQVSAAAQAATDATRIGVAVERYRLAHGRNPAKLEDLVPKYLPAVPADALHAKPIRYKPLADGGFLVWSIGEDGADAGGAALDPATGKWAVQGDDVPFLVRRPAQASN